MAGSRQWIVAWQDSPAPPVADVDHFPRTVASRLLQVKDDDPPEYVALLEGINDRLIQRTLAMGGTCTGEHGVGIGKKKYLSREKGEGAVEMMRTLKRALEPHGILNPGKVVDV